MLAAESEAVVIGESGSGKSVLVGALGLVLGANAPANCIRSPAQSAMLEARVHVDPHMLVSALILATALS